MVNDFDDEEFDEDFDDEEFDDADLTEDEIAEIKRAEQDINMGFTFTSFHDENGKWCLKCDKCQRTAEVGERPFPHKYDCPMKR